MKKLLALLLAFAMVLSTVTVAFAEETISDEAAALKALNVLKGTNGVTAEYLASEPQRYQAAIIFLRLKGLEQEALDFGFEGKANFADVEQVNWDGLKSIMAYLKANPELGWKGDSEGNFNAYAPITAQQYYKVMLESLGYKQNTAEVIGDFTWDGVIEFAAELGLTRVADVENFTVNDLAIATVEALVTPVKGEDVTLADTLIEAGVIEAEVAYEVGVAVDPVAKAIAEAVEAAEEAIAAIGEVTLDSEAAIEAAVAAVDAAKELSEDVVIANEDVLDAAIAKLAELELAAAVKVKSVTALSNTRVKVTLEEAATTVSVDAFAITDKDSKAVAVKSATLSADGLSVVVTTTNTMTAGQLYTLTANGVSKQFVAKTAVTDKLEVTTAVAKNNVEVEVTFSAEVDMNLALNAANYTFDNGLTVLGVAKSAANKVVLTTNAQTTGKLYKLTVANVKDLNDNALNSDKTTAYFGGKAADIGKPTITAASGTNTRFKITITDQSDLDESTVLNPANYVIEGLTVTGVAYDKDGNGDDIKNVVVVSTSAQKSGTLYKVTVNNIADKFGNVIAANTVVYFGGKAADADKPTATASPLSNTSVNITFADASEIDEISAELVSNYTIAGLAITGAELNGKVVTLTTAAQTAGTLYKVVINNVKDEYGNVIAANTEVYFGGKAKDVSNPTYTATAVDNTTVTITFSAKVDSKTVLAQNFNVLDLGYALSATLESNGTDVTIKTLGQTSGKIYTVEVRNVTNTDGTAVKSDSKATFAGKGTATTSAPKVLAATAIDNKTIIVTFDQALATLPVVNVRNNNAGLTEFDNTVAVAWNNSAKTEVRVTVDAATFADGTLYKAIVVGGGIGANGIATSTTENNSAIFAGIAIAPTAPKILAATAVDNNTVKVFFDQAITDALLVDSTIELWSTASTPAQLNYQDGNPAVVAQTSSLSDDGKELTVYFRKAGETLSLTEGTIYQIRFTTPSQIKTDPSGVALAADTDKSYASVRFGAVGTAVSGPSILGLVPQSKYVVDLVFDRPVAIQEDGTTIESTLVIRPVSSGAVMPVVKLAKVLSDGKTVRLFLDEAAPSNTDLVEGTVYTIRYTPDATNYFSDAVDSGVKLDLGTASYKDYNFAALGTAAAGPAITAVTNVNANTINVALDQVSTGLVDNNDIVVKEGSTDISSNVKVVVAADGKSFKVVRTDGIFKAGTTYSVALTADVKDESAKRVAKTDAVTFGGIGNVNLVLVYNTLSLKEDDTLPGNGLELGANVLGVTLQDSSSAAVNGKELRFRVLTDKNVATTVVADTQTTASGAATWTIGNHEAGEVYVVEATDGSVAITVVHP